VDVNFAKEASRREEYIKSTVPDSVSYRQKKVKNINNYYI